MRRVGLVLVSSLFVFAAACGGSSGTKPDGGGGSGGHAGSTAGTGGGSAGSTAGTGGGSAGSTAGTGGGAGSTAGASGSTAGASGSTAGSAGTDAGTDATTDAGDGGLSAVATRGQYLVLNVLGCSGCHTPKLAGGAADTTKLLSGIDCFAKDTASGGCLGSANLTNDATGIKNLTDQQVKDAFTKGTYPGGDAGTQYLFSNMPYYQFANLSAADADAIVAYLRALPPIAHAAAANGGPYATRPTAAQWAAVPLASYPNAATPDAGAGSDAAATDAAADAPVDAPAADAPAADAAATTDAAATPSAASLANGRYLASLVCSTCHTVNATVADGGAPDPLILEATKLFQGGKEFNTSIMVPADGGADAGADAGDGGTDAATTVTIMKKIQSANLTPDTTGLKAWTPAQIVTAIKTGKDEGGRTICSPMRPFPGITDSDALDIANYLKAIPPITNAITATCE
jgi:mono/diheme cytochrome c family protein